MARLPTPGSDSGQWGDILNDFLKQVHTDTGSLKDNSVSTSTIQNNAITANKLSPGSVTSASLASGAVTSAALASNAVSTSTIQDNAVSGSKITDGSIVEAKLDSELRAKLNATTSPTISDGSISTVKLADKAVSEAKLDDATATKLNTQSDWNQTDNTKVDYIKNKPTIPTVTGTNTGDQTLTLMGNSLSISGSSGNSVTLPAGSTGETNTASNIGTSGVGVFKQKTGVDLELKKLAAASNKVSITDNTTNNTVDIEVNTANLGIPTSLASLTTDVSIATPADKQVLTYDGAASKWKNVAPTPALPDTDTTLGGASSSDSKVSSQKAVKTYVDSGLATKVSTTDVYTKTAADAAFAPKTHTHAIAEVTNLQTSLDGKVATSILGADGELLTRTNGSPAGISRTQLASDPAFVNTFSPTAVSYGGLFAPGRKWIFVGDSITNGSSATNFMYGYMSQAIQMVGPLVARIDSLEAGLPGDRAEWLQSRMPAILEQNPEAVVLMIGVNDAPNSNVATYSGHLINIVKQFKAKGIPIVLGTIPAQGSGGGATKLVNIQAYNTFIKLIMPQYGCEIADVYTALSDPATGYLQSVYDSGDGIHPNNLGHQRMAVEVAKAMQRVSGNGWRSCLITSKSTESNMMADPLMMRASVTSGSGYYEQPGGTGTAPTYTMVNDMTGRLAAGRWAEMDFDGTTSGGTRRIGFSISSGFSVGDRLMLISNMSVMDISGDWQIKSTSGGGGASINMHLLNQSAVNKAQLTYGCGGVPDGSGIYHIGPMASYWTVEAGTTQLLVWSAASVPTGSHYKFRWGCQGIINLTKLGLDGMIGQGNAVVNFQ